MSTLQERYSELFYSTRGQEVKKWPAGHKSGEKVDPQSNLTIKIVDLILEQAVIERASDIHLEPLDGKLRIRYRIDGKLYEALFIENDPNLTIISRIKVISNLSLDAISKKKAQDGRFSIRFGEGEYDFRVATFPTLQGEKLAIRVLNKDLGLVHLDMLGLNPSDLKRLNKLLQHKNGLILVSGPMGSGKTTTLYAILNKLNDPENNIVTLEDPVEYHFNGMNQVDIHTKTDFGYAEGLKAVLRQDSNVILVGEIRDSETAEIALRGSLTGHVVLSSVHANSAIGTVVRLLNMGLDRYMVSYALIGAIAQRLVRKICEHCRVQHTVGLEYMELFKNDYGIDIQGLLGMSEKKSDGTIKYVLGPEYEKNVLSLCEGKGCEHCFGTGYRGRTAIFEIVLFDEELRQAILRNASTAELKEIAMKQGTQLLGMDGLMKVKQGITSMEEIIPVLVDS